MFRVKKERRGGEHVDTKFGAGYSSTSQFHFPPRLKGFTHRLGTTTMTKYVLIKRSDTFSGLPRSSLTVDDVKTAIATIGGVDWHREDSGTQVRNTDGTFSWAPPAEGVLIEGDGILHLVYNCNDGVAVHTDEQPSCLSLACRIAVLLCATAFAVPSGTQLTDLEQPGC